MKVGWHAWQLKTGETIRERPASEGYWICSGIKLGLVDGDFPRNAAKVIIFYAFDPVECAQVHPPRFRVQGLGYKVYGVRVKGSGFRV